MYTEVRGFDVSEVMCLCLFVTTHLSCFDRAAHETFFLIETESQMDLVSSFTLSTAQLES